MKPKELTHQDKSEKWQSIFRDSSTEYPKTAEHMALKQNLPLLLWFITYTVTIISQISQPPHKAHDIKQERKEHFMRPLQVQVPMQN